jgi:hypothetical protein
MVNKIVAWETSGRSFMGRAVLVADDSDGAGDFVVDSEVLSATVLSSLIEPGKEATRNGILQAFDDDASIVNYVGHGGIHLWADENILNIDDVERFALQENQPLVLTMNSLNGYFHFPFFDSLAEALLKAEGKGAVAVFLPGGLSVNGAAHLFNLALLEQVLNGNQARLGDAVLAAQIVYTGAGAFPEMLAIYHLFGDPAMKIQ